MTGKDKDLLIIRSASFQQLDKSLPELIQRFPDHRFHMLTHEHGVQLAEKYNQIDKVHVYQHKESFAFRRKADHLRAEHFDTVIVPVTNLTGAGFYNVLLFALTIKTNNIYLCNMISELQRMSKAKILMIGLVNMLMKCIAAILTFLIMIPVGVLLPWKLKSIKKI